MDITGIYINGVYYIGLGLQMLLRINVNLTSDFTSVYHCP